MTNAAARASAPGSLGVAAERDRPTLPAGVAFAGAAFAFTSLYVAAGALMPLLPLYGVQWALTPALLTLAFAVFAIGFLVAILTLGSLSDHVGRRPVLLGALLIQLASNFIFLVAADIGWVIAGRLVQGIATGAATAAFTALLVELAPPNRKRLGIILGSVGLTGGLGVGSLLAGIVIQRTAAPNSVIFGVLLVATLLGIVVIALSPETTTRQPGALHSLIPRVVVPRSARREFAAAVPALAAIWMLSGLSGGLCPTMVSSVFLLDSSLVAGLSGSVAPAASAAIGLAFATVDPRRSMTVGIYASIVGAAGIVGGVCAGSLALMIVGQTIAGAGFGASFTGGLRLVLPLVATHQRAGIAAGIYLVCYLAFGVPIVIAGVIANIVGLEPTVYWYVAATMILASIGLGAQLHLRHESP
ncbi:MAG: MFS transporter [Mycobacterium sp.]